MSPAVEGVKLSSKGNAVEFFCYFYAADTYMCRYEIKIYYRTAV